MVSNTVYRRWLGTPEPFDPRAAFVTSPFFSPSVLAVLRFTFAAYTTAALTVVLVNNIVDGEGASFFSYFTRLSYIGVISWLWASAVQTALYALHRRSERSLGEDASDAKSLAYAYPLQSWPRPLQFLHVLLWSTISSYPILVTAVFWGLLADSKTFSTTFSAWSNISEHAMNTGFALFEIFLTNNPPAPWVHVPWLVIILGGYIGVAYITSATQHFYVYPFLNPKKEGAKLAIYIVGIPVFAIVVFCIVNGLVRLRQKLTRGRGLAPADTLMMSEKNANVA